MTPPDFATARLDIDLGAILHNYRTLQARAGGAEVAPVVKADAYGLGMARIAPWLARHGAKTFFVARLNEGIALRQALGAGPVIYVLDGLSDSAAFITSDLRPVINTTSQYQQWIGGPAGLKAALHIDTGMNRLGLRSEAIATLATRDPHDLTLVMSHLACADEPDHPLNPQQLSVFEALTRAFPGVRRSLANSAGSFLGDNYALEVTRPGISLYGGGPFGVSHPDIRPVACLKAQILQVREVHPGDSVGYGATFTAIERMQIAIIGLGYADGLLRGLAAKGSAFLCNQRRPFIGRVSMDVFALDVSGLNVTPGDEVEILGAQQPLDDVAAAAGSLSYEILTRLGPRITRRYIGA